MFIKNVSLLTQHSSIIDPHKLFETQTTSVTFGAIDPKSSKNKFLITMINTKIHPTSFDYLVDFLTTTPQSFSFQFEDFHCYPIFNIICDNCCSIQMLNHKNTKPPSTTIQYLFNNILVKHPFTNGRMDINITQSIAFDHFDRIGKRLHECQKDC
jgi:hypothetical protein